MDDSFTAALADRYRIERELGRGGMATVYLAHYLALRSDAEPSVRPSVDSDRAELAKLVGNQ